MKIRRFVQILCFVNLQIGLSVNLAFAADKVSLVFDQVSIIDLAKIAYGELAREQVIFTDVALKATEIVSLTLRGIDRDQAIDQVGELLRNAGYAAEHRAGVVWIDKAKPGDEMDFFYRPKHRSVSYLVDMLSPLFKLGAFTLQRGLTTQHPVNQVQPLQGPQNGQQQPSVIDGGGSVYSMMDKNPDAFLFKGQKKDLEHLGQLLAQIDIPTPEILVKAVIFEVSTDSRDQSALSLAAQLLGGKLSLSIGKVTSSDYSAIFNGASLQAAYNVLASDSRFKVVSSPTLRVRSGANARLTVGNETPVLGAVSYDRDGRATQSVEYKPSGVILDLKPQIREDVAELQINQQISNFIATTTGVNNSPTLIKRELSTSVGVKPDEVLVLGGMDQDQNTEEKSGISWLPDFLRSSGNHKSRSEILLLLQASRI